MHNQTATVRQATQELVETTPDKMAAELNNLRGNFSKQDAADFLYRSGFPMSDVVEHIDEVMERCGATP